MTFLQRFALPFAPRARRSDDPRCHAATAIRRHRGTTPYLKSERQRAEQDREDDARIRRRMTLAASALVLGFLVMTGRLFALQVGEHDKYTQLYEQSLVKDPRLAVRGAITDASETTIFATMRLSGQSAYLVPCLLDDEARGQLAIYLGKLFDIDPNVLYDRWARLAGKQFAWIKRHLSEDELKAYAAVQEVYPAALGLRQERERVYPHGTMLAQVIGYTNVDGLGLEGVEARYQSTLTGADGYRVRLRDARGRRVDTAAAGFPDVPAVDGSTVALTIDPAIQAILEDALDQCVENWKPRGCTAIVMDPMTGRILAIASRPTFDPNAPGLAAPEQRRNRAITDGFEPGSIVKPVVALAAAQDGAIMIDPDEIIFCENGAYRIVYRDETGRVRARRVLTDHHGHGDMTVGEILVKSSNIGMAKIGARMGVERTLWYLREYGFWTRTGVDLIGEISGIEPALEQYPAVHTLPSVTMGHGMAATPLQLLTAYNAIANGGYRLRPQIIDHIRDPIGNLTYRAPDRDIRGRPITSERALAWVRDALVRVCSTDGTARRASLTKYGIDVAGKTGTAEKIRFFCKTHADVTYAESGECAECGATMRADYDSRFKVCSFLAFAPAEAPRYSILVSVDEPQEGYEGLELFGGTVAAPIVRDVLLRTFHIKGHFDYLRQDANPFER